MTTALTYHERRLEETCEKPRSVTPFLAPATAGGPPPVALVVGAALAGR